MSYLVLARRWRPRRFDGLVGQPHVTRTMLNGIRQGRVAHAYLFSGPRGIGKTSTARLLAAALNCRQPNGGEPCGKCDSCRAVEKGRAIDVVEIDAASNRGIDEIRQLRDGVRYAPIEGRAKVYIIDEVHMLTQEAFNALLKTLEEPPEHAYFCLATTAPQKVPATILSRCQRFDFRRVPAGDIAAHLEHICREDKIDCEPEALRMIARRADGSVRDALSLLDQVIAFAGGSVTRREAGEVVGEPRLDLFFRAVDLIQSTSAADALALDGELAAAGADPQDFIVGLENHLMQIVHAKAAGVDRLDVPDEFRDDFGRAAERLAEGDLVRLMQLCAAAEVDVRRSYNPRLRLQLLLLRFASFDRTVVLSELINRLEGGTGRADVAGDRTARIAQAGMPSSQPQGELPVVKKPAAARDMGAEPEAVSEKPAAEDDPLKTLQQRWEELCDRVSLEHNSHGKIIKYGGFPVALKDGKLTIHFSSGAHLESGRALRRALQREINGIIGEVKLELKQGDLPVREGVLDDRSDPAMKLLAERLDARQVN